MTLQLRRDGIQKDPIIADASTNTVLDGMHRVGAFKELGIGYAVCSLVDYMSESVALGRWLRVYRSPAGDSTPEMAEALGLTNRSEINDARRRLDSRKIQVAAFGGGGAFLPVDAGGVDDGFAILRKADSTAESRSWERTFAREEELEKHARESDEMVLLLRRFEKDEVLRAGTTGRLFPCKTSMHIVDPRPVAVDVPLVELESGSRKTLSRRLSEKKFELLPPGSVYEGRKYKERLLLMSER